MTTEIYRIDDAATGDGLTIERDADRLIVVLAIEGREHTLILADGLRVGERIAEALRGAPREPARVPQRVAL